MRERGEWQTIQQIGTKDPRWKAVRTCQLPSSLLAIGNVLLSTSSVLVTVQYNHPMRWGFSREVRPQVSGTQPANAQQESPRSGRLPCTPGPTGLYKHSWF